MWSFLGLRLAACCLWLEPSILRLGACSSWPLIFILGPNFSQALLMILSSSAMVVSCAGDAWLTSIVNFFIFPSPIFFLLGPCCPPSGLQVVAHPSMFESSQSLTKSNIFSCHVFFLPTVQTPLGLKNNS